MNELIYLASGFGAGLLVAIGILVGYAANRGLSGVASDILDIKADLAHLKEKIPFTTPAPTPAPAPVTPSEPSADQAK